MKYEVFSRSKFRDGAHAGDDAVLLIPGILAGVFDGATDPVGGQKNDQSPGQFAARCVARCCAEMFLNPTNLTLEIDIILERLSQSLKDNVSQMGFLGTPSTTLALALFLPDAVRILTVGDSGVRVNGDKTYRHCKIIDDVSASARVAVFHKLKSRISDLDQLEYSTRSVAFLGMNEAINKSILSADESEEIYEAVQNEFQQKIPPSDIADFLKNGIKSQNRFANRPEHPLGYSTLNGAKPSLEGTTDKAFDVGEVKSIELFTDGYSRLPEGLGVTDWEAAYRESEQTDFHKTGAHRCVKGSTSTEYFDDRSIISIRL